jgi:hypothetical protein
MPSASSSPTRTLSRCRFRTDAAMTPEQILQALPNWLVFAFVVTNMLALGL